MYLQAADGQVVVVEAATEDRVTLRHHANVDHMTRYQSQTETEYENSPQTEEVVTVDLSSMADASKSKKENILLAGLEAIQTLDKFSGWTPVIA